MKKLTTALITMLATLTVISMAPALAEELIEYDRSILEKLKITIEVEYRYVAGGFDEDGNWVIRYAVERYEKNATVDKILYENSRRAVNIWNASIREYAEKYNCTQLKKLILRFMGYAGEEKNYDVVIRISPTAPPNIGGFYDVDARSIVVYARSIDISQPLPALMFIIISHEVGHSLGLGHYANEIPLADPLIDLRGYEFSFNTGALTHLGVPSTMELYALCQLFKPVEDGLPPRLAGVIELPDDPKGRFTVGIGVVYVFLARGDKQIIEPPAPHDFTYIMRWPLYAGYESAFDLPEAHLNSSGMGLKGADLVVYPLKSFCGHVRENIYSMRIIACNANEPYFILRDYGNGTLEAVVDFNIYRVVYDKIYLYNKRGTSRLYLLDKPADPKSLELPKGITHDAIKYIVVLRGEECGRGECYESVEWMRDGRILIRGVKEDLLVKVDLDKVYLFSIDVAPFNYTYAVDSPKRLLEVRFIDEGGNVTYAPRGSKIYVKPLATVLEYGNGSRLRITGWSAGHWNGSHLEVSLDKPVEVKPVIAKEYMVAVESPLGSFANTGWVLEGTKITIYPESKVVDFGNGTRMVFKGFDGYEGESVTLTVKNPVKLKALWARQHRVSVESRYFTNTATWVNEGELYFALARKEADFKNGTYIRLRSFKAYIGNETIDSEDLGDSVRVIVGVRRPTTFKASWDTYYTVSLSSEAPVTSSCPGLQLEGTICNASAEESIVYGNGTVRRFRGWLVDGEIIPDRSISLEVLMPLDIKALWDTYDYVTFMLDAGDGYVVQADKVVLDDGLVIEGSGFIKRGVWRVSQAWYRGVEVSKHVEVAVRGAGAIIIPSRLRAVNVKVSDLLGMPSPRTIITTPFSQAATDWGGHSTLYAIPPMAIKLGLRHILGESFTELPGDITDIEVKIPLSIYTLLIMVAAAALSGYMGVGRWLRREG